MASEDPDKKNDATEEGSSRRSLLTWIAVAFGAAATVAVGIPIVGYLLNPWLRRQPDQWVDAGSVDEYVPGQTKLISMKNPLGRPWIGESGMVSAYVRRDVTKAFSVFAVNCTHLGCPVDWFPTAGLFMCPCHGGIYYADGSYAAGPPPRGLYHIPHRITRGRLHIKMGHLPTLAEPA